MKVFSFLILLTVLFVADYALALPPTPCPCDTAQLPNGLSGNDIVSILCPGGNIAEGNIWVLNPSVVGINGEIANGSGAAYQVLTLNPPICQITDFINPPVNVNLTDQQLETCRQRLIIGCDLIIPRPIPTLSEWGLIAMAGFMGIAGFIVIRRRKVAA